MDRVTTFKQDPYPRKHSSETLAPLRGADECVRPYVLRADSGVKSLGARDWTARSDSRMEMSWQKLAIRQPTRSRVLIPTRS